MQTQPKNIIVLGGGYAGIMASLRLAGKTKRLNTSITLVNGLEYFVERPRLHEQATGAALRNPPIRHMLRGTKVNFLHGWVTAIDPVQQMVVIKTTDNEQYLPYDYLINALGSRVDRSMVPGVDEHAFTLDPYGKLTTHNLQKKLTEYVDTPFAVAVIGGGATGVEAAAQFKAMHPLSSVSIITRGRVGAFKNARVQEHIQQALTEQSITLVENRRVCRVEENAVVFDSGRLTADIIIWAGGFTASPLAKKAGLRVNIQNQVLVDPYLRSLSHPNIYAVGDAAITVEEPGAPMRMALFTALVSGAQAADNIAAELKGKSLQPLSYVWYGQGIALGPNDAVGFPTYPADKARGFILRRKVAVAVRNFFVWYLGAALRIEHQFPGLFYWNGKKRYAKQQRLREKNQQAASHI